MCTVKEIREAIREDCHSQHGMEFIEIDRVLQTLAEDSYQNALQDQQRRKIKIKRYARVVEGHILDFKPGKKRTRKYRES